MDFVVTEKRRAVWNVQLDLLDTFKEICKRHDLHYCAFAGTLLGAVRHQGFIPWDDDIDLLMPRPDYEKFLQVAKAELKAPLFLQIPETDPEYFYGHAKIRNSNTTAMRAVNWRIGASFNQGIFIDIFPLDIIPEEGMERDKFFKRVRHMHGRTKLSEYWWKEIAHPGLVLTAKYVLYSLERKLVGKLKYNQKYMALCATYQKSDYGWISPIQEDINPGCIYRREWFETFTEAPFDRTTIAIPNGAEEALTSQFGNWQVPVYNGSKHGEIFYDLDKPYTTYVGRYKECHGDSDEVYVL